MYKTLVRMPFDKLYRIAKYHLVHREANSATSLQIVKIVMASSLMRLAGKGVPLKSETGMWLKT